MKELEIAAYLDRGLPAQERDRIEDHLAECADCRQNVVEAQALLEKVRKPRRLVRVGMLVAAAAALLIVMRPGMLSRGDVADSRMRTETTAAPALVAHGPVGETSARPLRFMWSADANALSYRLSVTRANATPLWSASGTDTVAVLPDSIVLHAGERYYWVVDALLNDGSTRSTGIREFELTR